MTQTPFGQLKELWDNVIKQALAEWRAMRPEERQEWQDKCPPELKNGLTFFLIQRLYAPSQDPPQS